MTICGKFDYNPLTKHEDAKQVLTDTTVSKMISKRHS